MKSTKLVADSHTFPTKLGADSPSPPHHHHHHHHHHTTSPFPSTFYYEHEPTSVLDPHLTSSPSLAAPPRPPPPPPPPPPQQQQQQADSNSAGAGEWDPLSSWLLSERDLALDLPQFPSFDASPFSDPFETLTTPPFDRPHLELLLRAADSLESGDPHSAELALARLHPHLAAPLGPPLQRAAFYFKEALLSLLLHGGAGASPHGAAGATMISAAEVVRRIGAHKAFSDLSPVPQFASFTANQTLLEAFDAAGAAAASSVHVVDFDLGLGGQWSSFAHEVAARGRASAAQPPAIRVTAVVAEETPEAALAAENLRDFARGLGLRLSVDLVRLGPAGAALALGAVRLSPGEPVAVVLSPAALRLVAGSGGSGGGGAEGSAALVRFLRRAAPRAAVLVDAEGCGGGGAASLRRAVEGGVEYYSAVLEAAEAAAGAAGEEAVRRVERGLVGPRVAAAVGTWWARGEPAHELLGRAGLEPVGFSEFAESQAEWIVRRAPVDGYHVARRDGSMVLSWRGRELASTSAWRC